MITQIISYIKVFAMIPPGRIENAVAAFGTLFRGAENVWVALGHVVVVPDFSLVVGVSLHPFGGQMWNDIPVMDNPICFRYITGISIREGFVTNSGLAESVKMEAILGDNLGGGKGGGGERCECCPKGVTSNQGVVGGILVLQLEEAVPHPRLP